jgi:hypothetical protein
MATAEVKKNKKTGLGKDLKQASNLAKKFLPSDPFTKVDSSRSSGIQDLIDQTRSLSDPFSQAYAGRRSAEQGNYLSRLLDSSQGYDSNEVRALRDARRGEMERGFQSGRAALARGQNNYRLGATQKAAQLAELAQGYGRDSAQAENELMSKFADEKQRRLNEYGTALTGAEGTEYDRGQAAVANYRDTLQTAEANEYDKFKFNAGQEAADRAQESAGKLGILGIQEARRNAAEQNALIREGYQSNERISGRNSSAGSVNSMADAIAGLRDEIAGGTSTTQQPATDGTRRLQINQPRRNIRPQRINGRRY